MHPMVRGAQEALPRGDDEPVAVDGTKAAAWLCTVAVVDRHPYLTDLARLA